LYAFLQNRFGDVYLKIVPVIDVLNGVVVHAVKGERSNYKPLRSILVDSVDPVDVASSFKSFGFKELYIADLDAILGKVENLLIFQRISEKTGLELMVDAGFADLGRAQNALTHHVSKIVIGTETLESLNFVKEAVSVLGQQHVVVSLDLKDQKLICKLGIETKTPEVLANRFQRMGVLQFIVLDLKKVGSESGVDLPVIREILKNPNISLFFGGGVRDMRDLIDLERTGVSGALIATALHNGRISLNDLRDRGFL
jgi:phosphoribosylformimino-5-aminoimidazole carboxamide ribotide isomerase